MFSLFNRLRPVEDVLAKLKNNTPSMTRCDYDAVFYRVFCVTLLAIAFTFTVILTNVFIDIDGLLAKKHSAHLSDNVINDEFTSEATDIDDVNYSENEDSYRTKRSIETQSFLFHIKNPKIKNILASRLSTLLEELEAEEAHIENKAKEKKANKDTPKEVTVGDTPKKAEEKKNKIEKDEDMLHLTMHNILLQGIIGHMDLNDVYKRIHSLMENFKKDGLIKSTPSILRSKPDEVSMAPEVTTEKAHSHILKPVEEKFFEELLNCNELHNEIQDAKQLNKKNEHKVPNIIIKTVIDIKSLGNERHAENDTKYSKENIKGIVELTYNGNTITFGHQDEEKTQVPQKQQPAHIDKVTPKKNKVVNETTTPKVSNDFNNIPKSYFNKFLEEYFKRFPQDKGISTEIKENYETKRFKRHIKIRYETEKLSKEKPEPKKEDDELYVEIETHFDSKGLKGEKKKKLVRKLIEKIQNAIHSDMDNKSAGMANANQKHKHRNIHFKKRLQDPLEHNNRVLMNKHPSLPINTVVHRQLNPISKTINNLENSLSISGKSGEEWKKPCLGPGFLAATKSLNSAEMSEVDVDYTKVLDVNGIPQRLQKPLNTELSEETVNTNSYYDLGKMKFFIKDIDGSGFSVGFNQYTDEPPDADTMKLFTGLENVIKTYHQSYDPADPTPEPAVNAEERNQEQPAANNDHVIARRSIKKQRDYHSNEYKIIFDDNFLPFNDYRDIFERKKPRKSHKMDKYKTRELIVDEKIFEKNLKPAEIFGLANLLDRKKRSMKVKKISNLKSKIKLNRFLNTNAMSSKRIFLNNKKRNKRQINKIRIIATDLPHMSKHSDENVFVVSDENIFADRAIVKELENSEMDHEKQEETDEPYQSEDTGPATYITKIFDSRSRHNPLMSKYPHIFMEEISRSREEYIPDNSLLFGKIPGFGKIHNIGAQKFEDKIPEEQINLAPVPNVTELPKPQKAPDVNNMLAQQPSKANYKVTMKIIPKNMTGLNSGFKEIHTSINKRFNKNGLLYSSLVNVSEISKVIKLNRTRNNVPGIDPQMAKKMREQQGKMQFLLKEHAKHINEQLTRLNEEKINLESILEEENNDTETLTGHLDYDEFDPGNPSNPPNGGEEEHNEPEKPTTIEVPEVTLEQTTIRTTHATTTPPPTHPPSVLYDKIKKTIMNTIEKNGNLTDQILKKIDTNTELLQMFLKKLTDRIQPPKPKPPEENKEEKEAKAIKYATAFPPDWAKQGMQFNQNMVIRKNDSHISIPFVYAYQQPIIPHQRDSPVASLIYHGHIHTNTIQTKENSAEKEQIKTVHKIPDTNNQSRFFIDELENDYKVIQVGDVKKNQNYNMVNGSKIML